MLFSLAAAGNSEPIKIYMGLVGKLMEKYSFTETQFSILYFGAMLVCIVVPYLLGSINPAVLISKTVYHEDIRNFGSGNAGTTNMLRTYGKKAAIATLLCDLGKAAVAVLLGKLLVGTDGGALAGFFVIFGHMFPIFAKFKGGKGVACLAMVALVISPISFLILLGMFLIIVLGTRFVSLASVMCAFMYPLMIRAFANDGLNVAMAVLIALAVVFMHRENLKRLWNGKESKIDLSKISKKKKGEDGESSDGDEA